MRPRLTSHLGLQLLALTLTAAAWSHDFWLEPSSFRPAADSPLFARLRVGEHFRGEALPRYEPWIKRFMILGPSGETPMLGLDGAEPAGLARVKVAGLHHIVYESTANYLELEPALFEKALRIEGLERIIELRARRGESNKRSKEDFYRCAKALVLVGDPPGQNFDQLFGLTLEIVPESNPYAMQPGDRLSFRLLFDGKPLEGALFMALNQADPNEPLHARSDSTGRAEFTLVRPGNWLIKAVHCIPARTNKAVDWESFWASLTFALGASDDSGSTRAGAAEAGDSPSGSTFTSSTASAGAGGAAGDSQAVTTASGPARGSGFASVPGVTLAATSATLPPGAPGVDAAAPPNPAAQASSAVLPQVDGAPSPAHPSSESMDPAKRRRLVGFGAGFLVAVSLLFLLRSRASRN